MSGVKPSYEELERRCLEAEAALKAVLAGKDTPVFGENNNLVARLADAETRRNRELLSIFDGIEEAIYIADPETYEILFANRTLRIAFGDNLVGGLCHEKLQGLSTPCPFCTNEILSRRYPDSYRWEHENPLSGRTYVLHDRLIDWPDGRRVRLELAIDVTERKRAEEALRESERKIRSVFLAAPVGIGLVSNRMLLDANECLCRMLGYTREELVGQSARMLYPAQEDFEYVGREKYRQIAEQGTGTVETRWRRNDGEILDVILSSTPLDPEDLTKGLTFTSLDITERTRAEAEKERLQAQLIQAQKMESIGRLAGGVAHDFNNMLGVILGYTNLALEKTDPAESIHAQLQEVRKAAERSATLTGQLLGFARKQTVSPKVLDLNDTVAGMLRWLRRLIGENIELTWHPGSSLWPIKMDPAQIDQVLANLLLNARDAIAGEGRVTIETGRVSLDERYCADHPECKPGDYVTLSVSDDGPGMCRETLEGIFEPFFTTKESGKGTGLGLATVYGIVRQNEGFINVYSEPGEGTVFHIYLPRTEETHPCQEHANRLPERPGGTEVVLVVEDEPAILKLAKMLLETLGYTVLVAGNPSRAEELAGQDGVRIDLLMSDVVMPGMNGRDLWERLRQLRPGLKCLFMSGYTANVIAHREVLEEGVHFIQKPFTLDALAHKVREALEG